MKLIIDAQHLLIYAAMAVHVLALPWVLARRRVAEAFFAAGWLVAVLAFFYRWLNVGHVPFQNLFEVFLAMGMLVYPLSLLARQMLEARGLAADVLIALAVLFPAGFVFSAAPQKLPPALQSPLFVPHVAAYLLAYVCMAQAAVQAVGQLLAARRSPGSGPDLIVRRARARRYERATYNLVRMGFPALTLGLLLGSYWAKLAWGDYWGWDPKELWSLASWLVYVGYVHFRWRYGVRYPRVNSLWALLGLAVILITLLWANLARMFAGLHNYAA